jgi:hypothetical protein
MLGTGLQNTWKVAFPKVYLCLWLLLLLGRGKDHFTSWQLIVLNAHGTTRHHLRFFQGAGPKYAPVQYFTFLSYSALSIKDKTGNIFGGLVVDKDVTNPNKSDFYLQSHPGLKGSKCPKVTWYDRLLSCCSIASRPGHYIVLYNKLNLSIDMWVIPGVWYSILSSPTVKNSTNKLLPMLRVRTMHKICIHSRASVL